MGRGEGVLMASVMDEETERERKELFEEVDGLHPQKAYQEIFDKVSSYLQKHKDARENDVEVLWRLARAYFDLAFEFEQKKQKERYVSQGRAVAEHMLRRFPEHAVSHKWFAILVSAHVCFPCGTAASILLSSLHTVSHSQCPFPMHTRAEMRAKGLTCMSRESF